MPEIIEVRNYADLIKKKLKNKKIVEINILNGRYKKKGPFENYKKLKKNLPFELLDVKTKGKMIYFIFDNNLFLVSKLGLMGGWCWLNNNDDKYDHSEHHKYYSQYGDKKMMDNYMRNSLNHLNFEIVTKEGKLYYYDVLSYGTLKCIDNQEDMNKILNSIGPDIMEKTTTFEVFKNQILKKTNMDKYIGNILINQKIISGLGNYLRADILWLSKISPFRKVKNLSEQEIENIFINCKKLIFGIYDKKNALKLKIINKNSLLPGNFNRLFFIYLQETDIFGNKVLKKELYDGSQKRFIYYVENIQK